MLQLQLTYFIDSKTSFLCLKLSSGVIFLYFIMSASDVIANIIPNLFAFFQQSYVSIMYNGT